MKTKDYELAFTLAMGHLLGSDFDWVGTVVITISFLIGSFIVNRSLEMYENRNKN